MVRALRRLGAIEVRHVQVVPERVAVLAPADLNV